MDRATQPQEKSQRRRSLLVFAHVPPPHHGQSQMVQYLVDHFSKCQDWDVHHVDARLSDDLEDIGTARGGKLWKLVRFIAQAIRIRLTHRPEVFYYVPSPPKRNSLYRDWLVMLFCRSCFPKTVLHWHAVGLGGWLENHATRWERWISHRLLGGIHTSLVLAPANLSDALRLRPQNHRLLANGVDDPAPNWALDEGPERSRRLREIQAAMSDPRPGREMSIVRVFFMALCTRDKGVHDAARAIVLANEQFAARKIPVRFELLVAGTFVDPDEEKEFEQLSGSAAADGRIRRSGFLDRTAKAKVFRESDVFLFPTYYANEGQPLNLMEAMAHGLPLVTTRWRSIPDYVPPDYPGLVNPQSPSDLAQAMIRVIASDHGPAFRTAFENRFTLQTHLRNLESLMAEVVDDR